MAKALTVTNVALSSIPTDTPNRLWLAFLRALKTTLQGIAGAFPAAGAGAAILTTGYWETLGYSCLAALIAGLVAFIQALASFLPDDATVDTN